MGYSKQERSTINTWYSLKKISYYTPTPPLRPPLHNGHFLLFPSVDNGFDCIAISFRQSVHPCFFLYLLCTTVWIFLNLVTQLLLITVETLKKSKSFFRPAAASGSFPRFPRKNVRLCNPARRP